MSMSFSLSLSLSLFLSLSLSIILYYNNNNNDIITNNVVILSADYCCYYCCCCCLYFWACDRRASVFYTDVRASRRGLPRLTDWAQSCCCCCCGGCSLDPTISCHLAPSRSRTWHSPPTSQPRTLQRCSPALLQQFHFFFHSRSFSLFIYSYDFISLSTIVHSLFTIRLTK